MAASIRPAMEARTANRLGRGPGTARAARLTRITPLQTYALRWNLRSISAKSAAACSRPPSTRRSEDVEHRGRRHGSERDQTAHPHRKRQHRGIPQREHPLIIIDAPMSGMRLAPWSAAAFARARAERKPVLLSIVTTWSRGCDEMDRTSYADSAVAGLDCRAVRADPR